MPEQQSELQNAINTVSTDSSNNELWDKIEQLSCEMDTPEMVANAYNHCLQQQHPPDTAVALGRRAASFHEEWFGDDPNGLAALLSRVMELSPKSEWAIQKLTYVLTIAERWDEVISLYQRVIEESTNQPRRIKLLDEAFQVTKDLAKRPDLAIDFLKAKIDIESTPAQLAVLERLLERHERWNDLIDLWRSAISDPDSTGQDKKFRCESLMRIATIYYEKLDDNANSLIVLREIFDDQVDHEPSLELLERIAVSSDIPAELRANALSMVREVYDSAERPRDTIRIIENALRFGDENVRKKLHAELGERLSDLGQHADALRHYATLLKLAPTSTQTQQALYREAQITGTFNDYADALTDAADSADDTNVAIALLSDAATVILESCNDEPKAIALLQSALAIEDLRPSDTLSLGKKLNQLLAKSERPAERLQVLQQLANAETVPSSRQALIGDVAVLAEEIGDIDQAIAAWRRRIDADHGDLSALEALVNILKKEERWYELIEVLGTRIHQPIPPHQIRSDLVQIAQIYEEHLDQKPKSLETWKDIKSKFGENQEVIAALSRLMTELELWKELNVLLENVSSKQVDYLANQFASLGISYQQSLEDSTKSIDCYRRSLAVDSTNAIARKGLEELLSREDTRDAAAEALSHSLRSNGELAGLLNVVEARLAGSSSLNKTIEILREAADIAQTHTNDDRKALDFLTRLFPLQPRSRSLEERMVTLAKKTSVWDECLHAYQKAAEAIQEDPRAVAHLRFRAAEAYEEHSEDPAPVLALHLLVTETIPEHEKSLTAIMRLGGPANRFPEISTAVLNYARERNIIPTDLISMMCEFAESNNSWDQLCQAMSSYAPMSGLSKHHQAEIQFSIAKWYVHKLDDTTAAMDALLSAANLNPARIDILRMLAGLQRGAPDAKLYKTLRLLCDIDSGQLQHFVECAELALNSLGAQEKEDSLVALQTRAVAAWRRFDSAEEGTNPELLVSWSVEQLVEFYVQNGQAQRALALLIDASRMPFPPPACLEMRTRAAAIAADVLKDSNSAIDMYRAVLSQSPGDKKAINALAKLYTCENQLPELLGLKRQELSFETDIDKSLTLRLEISHLIDQIDRVGGRLELLRTNLEQMPGHPATIETTTALLSNMNRHSDLIAILDEQAKILETQDQKPKAAQLWEQIATIAETVLEDTTTARAAYHKVVDLCPNLNALDSLAHLYTKDSQGAAAIPWLKQAINLADDSSRHLLVERLATAYLHADDALGAAACLQDATADTTKPLLPLREMLANIQRQTEKWRELAETLTATLPFTDNGELAILQAQEVADIYHEKLATPEDAIPALRRALELAPTDRNLQLLMARSLRRAGELSDAKQILESLVTSFGRRRTKERAAIHEELAQVARDSTDLTTAMAELELASKMDPENASILRQLADQSREQGDIERAERSLGALLLLVRRQVSAQESHDGPMPVGLSEVLFELHHIADLRGDDEKSRELLDSAIETASASDEESRKIRKTLLKYKKYELLATILRARVAASSDNQAKVELLGYVAELLVGPLQNSNAALDVRLQSIEFDPSDEKLHLMTQQLASEQNEISKYLNTLELLIERHRQVGPPELTGRLLIRAGMVAEQEMKDLSLSRAHYAAAETYPTSKVDSLFALARISAESGDSDEQTRSLDALTKLAIQNESVTSQADALYRLAELQVAQPDLVTRGVELLQKAMELEPRYRQAALTLRQAAMNSMNDLSVLQSYEAAARQCGDPYMLLEFLEIRIEQSPNVANTQEAVALATQLDLSDRATRLLENAMNVARNSDGGISSSIWAALSLIHHYSHVGKLARGKEILFEVANLAPSSEVMSLGLELSDRCRSADELAIAVEILDFLRERDPANSAIWSPLLAIYVDTKDGPRIAELVDSTLLSLVDPRDRSQLRLEKSRYLLASERYDDAVQVLQDAYLDDVDNLEVGNMLESVLRKQDNDVALVDFLWQRFTDAKEHKNKETIGEIAIRLGTQLDAMDKDSLPVLEQALEIVPESPPLLREAVHQLNDKNTTPEKISLTERLLRVEDPERVVHLALELVHMQDEIGDNAGAVRALELAFSICPSNVAIREELESRYLSSESWEPLAAMKHSEARSVDDTDTKVALLRQAARIYRDKLSNRTNCAAVLALAHTLAPKDGELAMELAAIHSANSDFQAGVEVLNNALQHHEGYDSVPFLLIRSDLFIHLGQTVQSIADLEQALPLDPQQVKPLLTQTLANAKATAISANDAELERSSTMRLVELSHSDNNDSDARDMLISWLQTHPDDLRALHILRDMDYQAQRWDGVVTATTRLIQLEEGSEQVNTALMLADVAERLDDHERGRDGLELVHQAQPANHDIRDRLKALYQIHNEHRELANLLVVDAQWRDDPDVQYTNYRSAALLYVNELRDPQSAVAPAKLARELRPDDHDSITLLTDVFVASGQFEDATKILKPAIARHKRRSPELASLQQRMSKVSAAQGDSEGQLSWIRKAFDVNRKDGEIASELAHLATERRDYDLALKPLRAITLMDNPAPVSRVMALLWEAKIEHARSNMAKAAMLAKKALREDPEYGEAVEFLAQLSD